MDFAKLFPFCPHTDAYNGQLEMLMLDEAEKEALSKEYKRRFLNNKDGRGKYAAIIKK